MFKRFVIVLGIIAVGFMSLVSPAQAIPNSDSWPTFIYNSTTSKAGHHIYAYTGSVCDGTRYKLEPGHGKNGIRSYKSPWDSTLRDTKGLSFFVKSPKCIWDIGQYDRGYGINIKVK